MNDERRIDDLIVAGDDARRAGHSELARQHYQEAALLDEGRLLALPEDAIKTRGLIVSNVATLLAQAHEYEQARRFIYRILNSSTVSPKTEKHLESILYHVLDRLEVASGDREYNDDVLGISLRGGDVGIGSAPADTVVTSMKSWQSLVVRFAEASMELPYRPRGPASPALLQAVSPRISQPAAGSFKFDLRLTRGTQGNLFHSKAVDHLVDDIAQFLKAASIGDARFVEARIPHEQYRETVLELTKSVIPTGRAVAEAGVTVRHFGEMPEREDLVLRPELRAELSALIGMVRKPPSGKVVTIEGTLRGLQLNSEWIIVNEGNKERRIFIASEALEDVIGPMVNHAVSVEAEETAGGSLQLVSIDLID